MGGAASGQKGSKYERELLRHFAAHEWGALRLPSSGSATTRDLPDVLAGRPYSCSGFIHTDAWAIELKSGKASTLYVASDEVEALEAFARTWGARPLLGARFTFDEGPHYHTTAHYLVRPGDARQTDGGNSGLPVDGIADRATWAVDDAGVRRL